ncbi:MAG: hypothetical protein M3P85_01945, partial [Actinomycetota bacterium]|nr:hypothetical protein [Actinomycetota bacterium]
MTPAVPDAAPSLPTVSPKIGDSRPAPPFAPRFPPPPPRPKPDAPPAPTTPAVPVPTTPPAPT